MKVYFSDREVLTLRGCIEEREQAVRRRAKEEGWRQSELAMVLADLAEVMLKLEHPKAKTVRK